MKNAEEPVRRLLCHIYECLLRDIGSRMLFMRQLVANASYIRVPIQAHMKPHALKKAVVARGVRRT
jgi:hypothetical protein